MLCCLQDFDSNSELKLKVKDMLEQMVFNPNLLPAEYKAAASILRVLTKDDESSQHRVQLDTLLLAPEVSTVTL